MKKSFILHLDSLSVLNELNVEQCGKLFLAIYNYQNGIELNPFNAPEDFGLRMAFLPFKNQFTRDGQKYENIIERNKENGKKGGRPKKTEITQPVFEKPKKADKDSVNENESENKNKNDLIIFNQFWYLYDKKTDRARCLAKWKKIFKENKQLSADTLINSVKQYVKNTPDPKFRKNPLTWLNGNCWEDEISTQLQNKKYIPTL